MHDPVYLIALTRIPGIGPVKSRALLSHFGSAEAICRAPKSALTHIPEIGPFSADMLNRPWPLAEAEKEFRFMEKFGVRLLAFNAPDYPERLRHCDDAPLVLFLKGNVNLNQNKIISIVGTRSATPYGLAFCEQLVTAISGFSPVVVSGLAFGIDICAHRACLRSGVTTIGCLAHGLDRIYPPQHAGVASEMLDNGGLITEFPSRTRPDRELFPMRNRIIAGLADCTVVIETDSRGGSMITAHIAHSYGREVYALPGRTDDLHSAGCNLLIRRNMAAILTGPEDLADHLGWTSPANTPAMQPTLFEQITDQEAAILDAFPPSGEADVDFIITKTELPVSSVNAALLSLEFRGALIALPGKTYRKIASLHYAK